MDFLKDLFSSFVAGLRERSTNPLTVAFVVSWLIWNYRLVLVLVGDATLAVKFDLLDHLSQTVYAPPNGSWFVQDGVGRTVGRLCIPLWLPLISALLYVYVYSWVSKWVVTFYRRRQIKLANALLDIEKGTRVDP